MNSATNSGKHCLKRVATLDRLARRDFGVSNSVSGSVRNRNVATATTAMMTHAIGRLRVTSSAKLNTNSTVSERNACEMPARYNLSACCRRPSYTSASASIILYTYTPPLMTSISPA